MNKNRYCIKEHFYNAIKLKEMYNELNEYMDYPIVNKCRKIETYNFPRNYITVIVGKIGLTKVNSDFGPSMLKFV